MNSFLNIQVRVLAAQAQRQLALLQRQLGAISFANATAGAAGFATAWNRMGMDRIGSRIQWLGRQIEYNFTLPLLLAGGAATKMALENERAFTRIIKVYGDGTHNAEFYRKEVEALGRAFEALSNRFGIAQADALNIAADWAAAGASGLALAKSVKLTMETMVLGEIEAANATKSLIAIQAQYGLSIDELSDAIGILNMVENQTGISMAGLIDGFARAAGVARSAGVSIRELAADLAALTPATGSASNAGNALKTIFSRLLSPTVEASEALKLMGININELGWQSAGAQQKLLIMAEAFDKLSDAQKGIVSSIIASRYQINRFEVLMRELLSTTGYYARALEATTDMNRVYTQAQYELNAVLSSNPRRLQILWTMLKNASANIIQPLIPAVLWLAEAIQRMVTAFSNLNPGVQKFVLLGVGLLAIVGPIVRYVGALQILFFELARALTLLLVPLRAVGIAFKLLIALPVQQFFAFLPIVIRSAIIGTLAALSMLPRAFAMAMIATRAVVAVGAIIVTDLWRMWLISLSNLTLFFTNFLAGTWRAATFAVTTLTAAMWLNIRILYIRGIATLQTILIAFAAWSGGIWRLITTTPLLMMRNMWAAILALWSGALPALRALGAAIFAAVTSPWGAAIAFVAILIVAFWDEIKQIWNNIVSWFRGNGKAMATAFKPLADAAQAVRNIVIKAFNALPEGIRNALLAVVRIIASAARAIYEWFSWINPWSRHSPSLVDNVRTGIEEIKRQYESLTGVGSAFARAAADLELFENATRRINRSVEANRYAEIRNDLIRLASDAVGPFDRLIRELWTLEDQLRSVEKAMDAQQAAVDSMRDNLETANDELDRQKNILSKMKDEADRYEDVVNRINGDLEVLTGTREALRQAGAGSDILGTYNDQIDALKNQKKGINEQLDAAQKAYEDQKKLVDSLTSARDKLQESYDLEQEKLEAIQDSYSKIREKIRDITSAINDFAASVAALKAAEEVTTGGGASNLGSAFGAAAGADFPDVGGSGLLGREGGIEDQSALIDEFTKEIAAKTKNMFGLFDFLEPVKKAWNKVKDWLRANIAPAFSFVGDMFSHMFDNISNPFDQPRFKGFIDTLKDMGKSIVDFFKSVWDLIGPPIKEIGRVIMDAFGRAFKEIGPELSKFKDLVGPLGELFRNLWTVLKPVAAIIGGVLLFAITILANVIANVLKPVLNFIIDVIKAVIKIFRGLIEFIVGVFTGNWELAWKGIKDIFGGIWDAIWSLLKNAWELIRGVVVGIVEGIVDFFKWLWNKLVGHSIIPDIINGIIKWFNRGADIVKAIWRAFMKALEWIWENILKPIFTAIKIAIDVMVAVFRFGMSKIQHYWELFKSAIRAAWNVASKVIGWIKNKFWDIVDGIRNAVSHVKGWIDDFVGKILGIKSRISGAFWGIFDGLKSAFRSAVNWIIGKWNNLSFGVGPFKAETPNIRFLAKGGRTNGVAIVGEGRRGYPEYVIPTDPQYRKRALSLFEALGNELGIDNLLGSANVFRLLVKQLTRGVAGDRVQFYASGGILGRASVRGSVRGGVVLVAPTEKNEYHFHGDLSFPNVKDGNDAEEFIKNLRALVGSS